MKDGRDETSMEENQTNIEYVISAEDFADIRSSIHKLKYAMEVHHYGGRRLLKATQSALLRAR